MDTRKGDIPETDQELEKILAVKQKPVKRTSKAPKSKALVVDIAPMDIAVNHEPGQPLPEDQAEQAASGSGWQGEEIPDTSVAIPQERLQELAEEFNATDPSILDVQLKTAKKAYRKSRGQTISPVEAERIAQEKGYDENGKSVKPARVKVKQEKSKPATKTSNRYTDEQLQHMRDLEAQPQPEITEALVKQILQLLGEGKSTIETREITKVHYTTIRNIARGKAYQQWSGLGTVEQKEEK